METEKYFVLCLVFFMVFFVFSLFVSSFAGLFEKQDHWVMPFSYTHLTLPMNRKW